MGKLKLIPLREVIDNEFGGNVRNAAISALKVDSSESVSSQVVSNMLNKDRMVVKVDGGYMLTSKHTVFIQAGVSKNVNE